QRPDCKSKNVSQSAIDWSNSGVPGGIPSGSWTQCGSTIQSATYGSGSIDATAAINAAIAACPTNTYVLLGPGIFLFNSSGAGSPQITLSRNGVVLRGSGAEQTILNSTGTNQDGYITIGQGNDPGRGYGTNNPVTNSVNITSGATAGSTSIVVSDGTHFAVGGAAVIQELNDASYVTKTGPSDQCNYCDGFWNGDRSRGQTVEVMSCSPSCGNHGTTTITISPPLYTAYDLTPQALPFTPTRYTGIEDLQIYSNNTHTSQRNAPIALFPVSTAGSRVSRRIIRMEITPQFIGRSTSRFATATSPTDSATDLARITMRCGSDSSPAPARSKT